MVLIKMAVITAVTKNRRVGVAVGFYRFRTYRNSMKNLQVLCSDIK